MLLGHDDGSLIAAVLNGWAAGALSDRERSAALALRAGAGERECAGFLRAVLVGGDAQVAQRTAVRREIAREAA